MNSIFTFALVSTFWLPLSSVGFRPISVDYKTYNTTWCYMRLLTVTEPRVHAKTPLVTHHFPHSPVVRLSPHIWLWRVFCPPSAGSRGKHKDTSWAQASTKMIVRSRDTFLQMIRHEHQASEWWVQGPKWLDGLTFVLVTIPVSFISNGTTDTTACKEAKSLTWVSSGEWSEHPETE